MDDKFRVLLIEDNPGDARLIQEMLLEIGETSFELEHISHLSAGLEHLSDGDIDLVLLDLSLPDSRGLDTFLMTHSVAAQVPIILLTGLDDKELALQAMRQGAQDYLVKGQVDSHLLVRAMRHAIERKRIEEALRASEERYRTLFNSAPVGLYHTRPDGKVLDINQAMIKMLGYADELDLSEFNADDIYINVEDRKRWMELAARNGIVKGFKVRLRHRDGSTIWGQMNAQAIYDASGKLLYYEGSIEDITEQVQSQIALQQYTDELQARNEELDAFADTVAHDLKGPLGLILGFAELLQMESGNMSQDQSEHIVQKIIKAGRKMHSIIKELLLLARLRQQEVEMNALDMAEIVAEAQQRLAHVIESTGAQITCPETWPSAVGHALWVEEIWINYLSNALKYGGQPPRIEIGGTIQANGEGRFWVRDNGPGLTPEEQSQLFQPFTRLNQIRAKGHGLGLSIVRRIAEKLGGTVGVESQVGEGSTFWFTLCTHRQSLGANSPNLQDSTRPTSGQTNM